LSHEPLANSLFALSYWDLLLILGVSAQATVLAYLRDPRWKAWLMTLPIPFTLANLSLGLPVEATNVLGLVLLLGYTGGVYGLYVRWRVPIVPAIMLGALGYCGLGSLLAAHLPRTGGAFWLAVGGVYLLGWYLYLRLPGRAEPAYRSPLPVPLKAGIISLVILFLVLLKQELQGFMTLFPMVGVVASYEGRHCLWTLTRQIPVIMLTLLPMMIVMRLLQPGLGQGPALAAGWLVMLATLLPLTRHQWSRDRRQAVATARSAS
jgi:hypothetical protein